MVTDLAGCSTIFYDVSVGKWSSGLSPIPILVHLEKDRASIWGAYGENGGTPSPAVGGGGVQ